MVLIFVAGIAADYDWSKFQVKKLVKCEKTTVENIDSVWKILIPRTRKEFIILLATG
jgi:hypothetical protein